MTESSEILSLEITCVTINIPEKYYGYLGGEWDFNHKIRWRTPAYQSRFEPFQDGSVSRGNIYVNKGINIITCNSENYSMIVEAVQQLATHIKEKL
jgi:hypothetical protein